MSTRKTNSLAVLLALSACEALASLIIYFANRSEAESAWLMGYSKGRLAIGLAFLLVVFALAAAALKSSAGLNGLGRARAWLETGQRLWWVNSLLIYLSFVLAGAYLFTYVALPSHLRPLIVWAAWMPLQAVLLSAWIFPNIYQQRPFGGFLKSLLFWRSFDPAQRRTFFVLLLLALVYFVAFIPTNRVDAQYNLISEIQNGDEYVTYPIVATMLTPGETLPETLYRLFIYEDYHYGYPFYFYSALTVLPVRLIGGEGFTSLTHINLFIMRQMVNVIPILLSALLLIWMRTRFRGLAASVALFVLIVMPQAVIGFNSRFWHPDSMVALAVVLALFFLERDRLRFGPSFYLAAAACGLAAALKLFGFFFFLAIAGYLAAGILTRRISWQKAALAGLAFVIVMALAILISDPFLLHPVARGRLVSIMTEKSSEVGQGYSYDPDGIYRTGIGPWLPFLQIGFGNAAYLLFILAGSILGCFWGARRLFDRLVLAWFIPPAIYLIFFTAVKVTHYWLPVMLPLIAAAVTPALFFREKITMGARDRQRLYQMGFWLSVAVPASALAAYLLNIFRLL